MQEVEEVADKSWGEVCADCQGTGKNTMGAECLSCRGYGLIQTGTFAPGFTMKEDIHREITVPKSPRIDFRGRAGPMKYARMKDFAIGFERALEQMSSRNAKYAKGAEMYLRLGLNVKGAELEAERPDLYCRAVELLSKRVTR